MDRALEITRNQMDAKESWEKVFGSITYFSEPLSELDGPKVTFVGGDNRPTIRDMAYEAARLPGWSAIVNADIVLMPKAIRLEQVLTNAKATCAISKRYEFEPPNPPGVGIIVDEGLDIFVAQARVWSKVAATIPEQFVIGKQLWDTWMMGFFAAHYRDTLVDFTYARVVWHPKHQNRGDFAIEVPEAEYYIRRVRWPRGRISF